MLQNGKSSKFGCSFFGHVMNWNWRPQRLKSWTWNSMTDNSMSPTIVILLAEMATKVLISPSFLEGTMKWFRLPIMELLLPAQCSGWSFKLSPAYFLFINQTKQLMKANCYLLIFIEYQRNRYVIKTEMNNFERQVKEVRALLCWSPILQKFSSKFPCSFWNYISNPIIWWFETNYTKQKLK